MRAYAEGRLAKGESLDVIIGGRQRPVPVEERPAGAATPVWAAVVAPADDIGGQYCENCHIGRIVPDGAPITVISEGLPACALDPKNAKALWKKSEELVRRVFLIL